MLVDCDERIYGAYYYTQDSIDQLERPCWLVFNEDASFENTTVNQELYQQGFSVAYIGQIFSGGAGYYGTEPLEYEEMTRQIAENAVKYLFEHQQMQVSNQRGLLPEPLQALDSVMLMKTDSRSGITLMSRDAVEGESFWGFTISLTITVQMPYDMYG